MLKIKHGFAGQRRVNLPFHLVEKSLQDPLSSGISIVYMGFFPNAAGHFIDRPNGCQEQILIYCVKGEGFYRLEGHVSKVREHQFFVLPANEAHRYGSNPDNPWSIWYVHFKGPASGRVCQLLSGLHTFSVSDSSRIRDRIDMFSDILYVLETSSDDGALLYANMSFQALLASFLETRWFEESSRHHKRQESFVSRACHLMSEQIDGRLNMSGISAQLDCSVPTFYRKFYAGTGYSPYDYFIRMKMMKARELLEQTPLKISQVSHMVGYDDVYYFSRYFRKAFGLSPRDYRDSLPKPSDALSR